MNLDFVCKKAKILNIEKKTNQGGTINWTIVTFFVGSNVNSCNCDNKLAEQLKVGSVYDLIVNVSEVPKAYKNGGGAYMENKFKITGIDVPN